MGSITRKREENKSSPQSVKNHTPHILGIVRLALTALTLVMPAEPCDGHPCNASLNPVMTRVGQNHIYIRCIYGDFGRGITKYTVVYGVYIQYKVLANPSHDCPNPCI